MKVAHKPKLRIFECPCCSCGKSDKGYWKKENRKKWLRNNKEYDNKINGHPDTMKQRETYAIHEIYEYEDSHTDIWYCNWQDWELWNSEDTVYPEDLEKVECKQKIKGIEKALISSKLM